MRKIRIFLMLTLLVVGVSGAWASKTYQVVYQGLPTGTSGSFSINNTYVATGYTYGNNNYVYERYTKNNSSSTLTQTVGYSRQANVNNVTNNNFTAFTGTGNDNIITQLNSSNISTYITPATISHYYVNITVDNTATGNYVGTITITYTEAEEYISYRVIYEKVHLSGTGYTVNSNAKSFVTTADDADVIIFHTTVSGAPISLTSSTVGNYITARQVDGYTIDFYVNEKEAQLGYHGNIYINYKSNESATVTYDDIWDYSNRYYRSTGSEILLADDECAISLHLTGEEVTETAEFYRYRIQDGNTYYYYDLNQEGTMFINGSSSGANTYPFSDDGETRLNGTTLTIDDPDTEFGDDIVYTYKSQGDWEEYSETTDGTKVYRKTFTYNRTRTIGISKVENAIIPAYAPDGRKVVGIQKWGLCYKQEDIEVVENCEINSNGTVNHNNITHIGNLVDDHSNLYLKTVTFESPSNLKSIGDYAFMSCKELVSVDIPNTVEYLGQGAFEMDTKLKDVNFQTLDDGTIKIKTIKNFTFWLCTAMETLYLPDGITEIEGQQSGASLQYMTSLINLRLPNTLERIGPHFLCSASSLKTLTIPVSVIYIDGASFHGCESLETVYILGPAAVLKGEYAEGNSGSASSTFSANTTLCKEAVNHCTFYTSEDHLEGYQNDDVWSRIDENGVYNPNNGLFGNTLKAIPSEKRVIPTTWVTALFPKGVENYEETFGTGTLVAVMKECTSYKTEVINGKSTRVYDISFELLPAGDPIPENKPVLIKAGHETEYEFYDAEDQEETWWKQNSTEDFPYGVTAPDGAVIQMKGRYLAHQLQPWDFYFMYQGKTTDENGRVVYPEEPAKFYRVPNQQNAATIKACRCWWTINVDNMRATDTMAKTFQNFFDEETTGIDGVENARVTIGGIYDLQGRKLDVDESELPQGLYIVNGKRVVKK